jgi:hypothetical protein
MNLFLLVRRLSQAAPLLFLAIAVAPAAAGVGDRNSGTVASEVTTDETGVDGVRHSADSDWTVFTVPANCVINKDKTSVEELTANGSEHYPNVEYADYVEVVPGTGIMAPRTIKVKTHALGPKGFKSGRGWLKVKVHFEYVQYK